MRYVSTRRDMLWEKERKEGEGLTTTFAPRDASLFSCLLFLLFVCPVDGGVPGRHIIAHAVWSSARGPSMPSMVFIGSATSAEKVERKPASTASVWTWLKVCDIVVLLMSTDWRESLSLELVSVPFEAAASLAVAIAGDPERRIEGNWVSEVVMMWSSRALNEGWLRV